jgi:hypothetical protein
MSARSSATKCEAPVDELERQVVGEALVPVPEYPAEASDARADRS